jgi:3-hydroxyisobutyrate dehydrogenase-like beta-hydroxyacid dehydrogenase
VQAAATSREVAVLDAPVTRNGAQQYGSEFTLLAGGEQAVVERVRPVLGLYADHVIHMGPLGSGQRMKAINNALAVGNLRLICDALSVGTSVGLEEAAMVDALRHGSGGSVMVDLLQFYRPRPRADYVHLLEKDITAFRSVAADASPQAAPTLNAAAGSMMSELLGALDD